MTRIGFSRLSFSTIKDEWYLPLWFLSATILDAVSTMRHDFDGSVTELNPVTAHFINNGTVTEAYMFMIGYPLIVGAVSHYLWATPSYRHRGRNLIIGLSLAQTFAGINNLYLYQHPLIALPITGGLLIICIQLVQDGMKKDKENSPDLTVYNDLP